MDSQTIVPSMLPPYLSTLASDNQRSIHDIREGGELPISSACEQVQTPSALHSMAAMTDESVQIKPSNPFSPVIPKSAHSGDAAGLSVPPGTRSGAVQPYSVAPFLEEPSSKTGPPDGATFSPEISLASIDLNYSLSTSSDPTRSCENSTSSTLASPNTNVPCVWPTTSVQEAAFPAPSQLSKTQPQGQRPDLPQPPKKPLSPYMRFSKGIWQQVKTANPGMSVCEVGATIGRIWRELDDANKQRFIEEFNNDKVRYDSELQGYLRMNGLQASDLIKPRAKKNPKDTTSGSKRSKAQQQKSQEAMQDSASGLSFPQPSPQFSAPDVQQGQQGVCMSHDLSSQEASVALPSFSQVWSNPESTSQRDLLAQVVYDSQLNDDRDVAETEGVNHSVPLFPNQGPMVAQQLQSVICNSKTNSNVPKNSTHQNANASGWWWANENNERFQGNAFQQPGTSEQSSVPGASFVETTIKTEPSKPLEMSAVNNCGWHEAGALVSGKVPDGNKPWPGQPNSAAGAQSGNEEKVTTVDAEKLFLRGALVEKTQEVVQLMRELEQAYGIIHQLKQQNDFFHRWYQEQRSAQE